MADTTPDPTQSETDLGAYLRQARRANGMTLRAVEGATNRAITNGYLSQIENGDIRQPSPRILHHLADAYGIDFGELMTRAGHRVPAPAGSRTSSDTLNGFPLRSLEDLSSKEMSDLLEYLDFIKSRR